MAYTDPNLEARRQAILGGSPKSQPNISPALSGGGYTDPNLEARRVQVYKTGPKRLPTTQPVTQIQKPNLVQNVFSGAQKLGGEVVSGVKGFFTPTGVSKPIQIKDNTKIDYNNLTPEAKKSIASLNVGEKIVTPSASLAPKKKVKPKTPNKTNLLDEIFSDPKKWLGEARNEVNETLISLATKGVVSNQNQVAPKREYGLPGETPEQSKARYEKAVKDAQRYGLAQAANRNTGLLISKLLEGKTGGILKADTSKSEFTRDQKITSQVAQILGAVGTIKFIAGKFAGIATGNATIAQTLSSVPKIGPRLIPFISNVAAFDIYGQLDPDTQERFKKLAEDTAVGALFTTVGGIKSPKISIPTNFAIGFGLAKAAGASNEDAFISGGILAVLDSAYRAKGLTKSAFKEGKAQFTPEQARNIVIGSNLENTALGKDILRNASIAEAQGKDIVIDMVAAKRSAIAKAFKLKTPNGIGIRSIDLVEPATPKPGEVGAGQEPAKPVTPTETTPPAELGKGGLIFHGTSKATDIVKSEGLQVSRNPIEFLGGAVYFSNNEQASQDYGPNNVSVNPSDFNLKTFNSPEEVQSYIQASGQNNLSDAVKQDSSLDGFIYTNPDPEVGDTYGITNTEKLNAIVKNENPEKTNNISSSSTIEEVNKNQPQNLNVEEKVSRPVVDTKDPEKIKKVYGSTEEEFIQKYLESHGYPSVRGLRGFIDVNRSYIPKEFNEESIVKKFQELNPSAQEAITLMNTEELISYVDRQGYRTPEQVTKLRKDIEENGIKYPVELIDNGDGTFEINDGTHRIQIAKDLGMKEIPIKVVGKKEGLPSPIGEVSKTQAQKKESKIDKEEGRAPSGQAATGSQPIGTFEKREPTGKVTDLKLFEKSKELVRKYAVRIGEGYTPKRALGSYHHESQNIRTNGMNDLSTNIHEIAHAVDDRFKISKEIYKPIGESKLGLPVYDPKTAKIRADMTSLYEKYYPTGRRTQPVEKRMTEGFATLVQKYVEMPRTIEAEFPELVKEFLKPSGKYYEKMIGDLIKDSSAIVEQYQGLEDLDKVGVRVVNQTYETDKSWLNLFDKARTIVEDEIWPIEKLGKMAGTNWTGEDPSLWLRQYSRGMGLYSNNILNDKQGYWTIDYTGEAKKTLSYNWKNLIDQLSAKKEIDSFGNYLVARDQAFEWKELDKLQKDYDKKVVVLDLMERFGIDKKDIERIPQVAEEMGVDASEIEGMIAEAKIAKEALQEQKQYLKNNGFIREEVESAYLANKERFAEEEKMYDALVRADLEFLHNPQVGIVNQEKFAELSSKEGYASMKRQFFDDIIGDEKATYAGAGKGPIKVSSLKGRTGGQQAIINPVLNGMINHIEITKKGIKQIIYNKIAKIAESGTTGDLLQKVELRSFKDDMGRITFPQEKEPDIIMARVNYKRTPILTDKIIKDTVENVLTFQNMNIFEDILLTASRTFTIGTTGAFAPFALANFPADQWTAMANTRNNYVPVIDGVKQVGKIINDRGGDVARYWNEWVVMGGDRLTLVQAQFDTTDKAVAYIKNEAKGLKKAVTLANRGLDIAGAPSKYSETLTRFTEYSKAREAGKSQIVAFEEAGRVSAPFHHIGSWKLGDRASGKFIVRSAPFTNASMQFLFQAIRTAETAKGRRRLLFVLLAMTAAYLASMAIVSKYGTDDQKEQYKDLKPSDIGNYLYFPSVTGEGLMRVRTSQNFSTLGLIASMIYAQNIYNTQYSREDWKDALTNWLPSQINPLEPVAALMSWLSPAIKIPVELAFNVKDYPRISPIESQGMLAREPGDRFNEGTSKLAKKLGEMFNISPLKTDFLITGLLGRATGYLTGKPNVYDPTSTVQREYLFTLGRRVEEVYKNSTVVDQKIKSLKLKYEGVSSDKIPESDHERYLKLQEQNSKYNQMEALLREYGDIDRKDEEALLEAREKLIPLIEELISEEIN